MPAGNFAVFNIAKKKLSDGTFDLDGNIFRMVLTTSAQAIASTFVGTSTNCQYSDLTNEVSGTGYTATGKLLTATWTQSVGTITWDVDDQAWSASTLSAKYAIIYENTSAQKNLLAWVDLETGGGSVSTTAGTLTVTINASGVFTLA